MEPGQELQNTGDRFGQVLLLGAARACAGVEGVVAVLDPDDADRLREPIAGHVLTVSEGVPRSLDDERRGSQVLQVLRAKPFGLARRMEGIPEADEPAHARA